jgi:hypothetical protein
VKGDTGRSSQRHRIFSAKGEDEDELHEDDADRRSDDALTMMNGFYHPMRKPQLAV